MKKVLLIAIVGLFIVSCGSDKKSKLQKLKKQYDEIALQIKDLEKEIAEEEGQNLNKVVDVVVTDLKKSPFDHYLEVQGRIDGDENVNVSPKIIGGVITSIDVKEGEEVKQGQVLAQIDDALLRQSLSSLDTTLVYYTNLFNKQKRLWEQKIGSEVQYLTAKNNKESIENQIKAMNEQITMSKILSPIDGTVEEIPIKVGQAVALGGTAFRVVNLSKVKVVADVAEAYSAKLKTGNEVKINFPDLDKEITTKISFSSKFINTTNRTFIVEMKLDENDESYRANMVAVIKINDYHADSTTIVPVNVIQKLSGDTYVFIAEKNSSNKYAAKKVKVKLGQTYNGNTEILDGLKEGDKIITIGYQNIEDGQLLKF